ncbi:MAG: 3-isopropylmalate dehydrogenase [Armatimonadota bacterium]|nr:3-isopropylmalate dehydrogenase [Armatimonadota bacterium]MDR7438321.1 3-isopropylmalate dehydrogenase [Armatimonadota bacterium]MDR7443357.1 3-isopropylmalate dehydrogenase [Armatimonadota bacterium]MDR7563501.1 3-isopropylmalate dehydrogenase [Armatimonadota bacterium]MDR7567974.1 3-isopropylmalate dehydrogenase [Armatimonadota bacterium]
MREFRVLLLGGDGIGPEVTGEAVRVLEAVSRRWEIRFRFEEAPIGGVAIDGYGDPLPPLTRSKLREVDAVLLGAVGGPRWDRGEKRPEAGLLELRRLLGVYANLRPAALFDGLEGCSPLRPEVVRGTDLLLVRELTGGLYFGEPKLRTEIRAVDTMAYSAEEVARVARVAFRAAARRRGVVHSVDKANVLETSRLWREVVCRVAQEFPQVKLHHMLVDTCAMELVRRPTAFDVILTENTFGDILSDEAAAVVGSIGLLPSASLGEHPPFLYEPVHGSAPDIAGRGIANPVGAILSAAMMLRYSLGMEEAAEAVERATEAVLREGVRTADLGGTASTEEVGRAIATRVARSAG